MGDTIINNRIAGTRITVWDITYYLERGRSPEYIAEVLPVTADQVREAIRFIEEHKPEVMAVHRQIEERHARGNSPEVEAKLSESRDKRLALMEQFRKAKRQEGNGEGSHR